MARLRIFVSSTYYDLKHIRASLEVFIEFLGYDAVLFEKGDIAFHPDAPLDESCYREAANADIFVLIIGGRYGSASSKDKAKSSAGDIYESVTKKEFDSAQAEDVPTFILIDNSVYSEYQTYLRNKDNDKINYAHVDSTSVFRLIESILEKSRNNPVFGFERATQIESWLREQWSGLFRELLRTRSQQRQLSTLNAQVAELTSVNDTLKTYLEAVLTKVNSQNSEKIIAEEEGKLSRHRIESKLKANYFFQHMTDRGLSDDQARAIIEDPRDADEVLTRVEKEMHEDRSVSEKGHPLRRTFAAQRDYNFARIILGRPEIDFTKSTSPDVAAVALRAAEIEKAGGDKRKLGGAARLKSGGGKLKPPPQGKE